jgi:excisionase family DNA binding protein
MISLDEIMDPDDVAELLHLKRSTVIDYARRGVLPGKKLGKHWLFLRSELDDTIHQLRGTYPGAR